MIKALHKELSTHLIDYLILFTAGVFFAISLSIVRGEKLMQFFILVVFTALYIIWGIYHHATHGGLHIKIVLEYILIGFTVLYLLQMIISP